MKKILICFVFFCIFIGNFVYAKTYDISEVSKAKIVTEYSDDTTVDMMDTVIFGSYPQFDVTGNIKDPIEWIVLEKQNDKVRLLSKCCLDYVRYCTEYNWDNSPGYWNTSHFRHWLNGSFLSDAFKDNECNRILDNNGDKVSILNNYDLDKYFDIYNKQVEYVFGGQISKLKDIIYDNGSIGDAWYFTKNINKLSSVGTNYTNYKLNMYGLERYYAGEINEDDICWDEGNLFLDVGYANWIDADHIGTHEGGWEMHYLPVRPVIWVSTSQLSPNSDVNESQNGNNNNYTTTQALSGRKTYDISEISKAKLVSEYNDDTTVDMMDTVTFGSYPQSDATGNIKEPIEWIVLGRDGDKTLLLSKYILDCKCYSDEWNEDITWENSTLRYWLNNTFYNSVFNSNEKSYIKTTYVINTSNNIDNENYDYSDGKDTYDNIFLLSIDEVDKYFQKTNDWDKRITYETNYEKAVNVYGDTLGSYTSALDGGVGSNTYWLRNTNALEKNSIVYVDSTGEAFVDNGMTYALGFSISGGLTGHAGVRPALWVSTSQSLQTNNNINEYQGLIDSIENMQVTNVEPAETKVLYGATYDISEVSKAKLVTEHSGDTTIDAMDTVTFGSYPQSDAIVKTKEPIEWIVLDKEDDKILLLSKYVLDHKNYNDEYKDITWEHCTLRYWLNNTFYNTVFDDREKSLIATTHILNKDKTLYNTSGGSNTDDNIFLLSVAEVKKYFNQFNMQSDNKKLATSKKYISKSANNLFADNNSKWYSDNSAFWLRTPGDYLNSASYVDANGYLREHGKPVADANGIRPALWISTSQLSQLNPYIILQKSDVKNLKYVKKRDGFLGLFGNVHYYVDIELINDVKDRFKDITGKNIGSIVNMIKDNGIYISSAVIKEQINNGRFNIESNSQVKAQDIANELTNSENYYFLLSKSATYDINVGRKAISDGGYTLKDYDSSRIYIIGLPSEESELRDNHFYKNNQMQKLTWVYYQGYYYYVDKDGNIIKNKWVDGRFVGEDGKLYISRKTPDNKWVGGDGLEVENVTKDLEDSLTVEEAKSDSWYRTELGLWYYFENDRKTTKKGWFHDTRDDQWYYLDPATGIMAIGFTVIDGDTYYFNEFPGREQNWYETGGGYYESYGKKVKALGSLYMNEYTPYGSFVDENGKLVQ